MSGLNKCLFIGNVGKDPEVSYNQNGEARASFSLAVNNKWKDKATGNMQEHTEWVRMTAFGKIADTIGQYVKKGSPLYVEGRFQTRKWTNDAGEEKYYTEIMVREFQFLGKKGDNYQDQNSSRDENEQRSKHGRTQEVDDEGFDDSDIPF